MLISLMTEEKGSVLAGNRRDERLENEGLVQAVMLLFMS